MQRQRTLEVPLFSETTRLGPLALTLTSAVLVVLTVPPRNFWPLALIAFVPFLLAVREATPRQAFTWGWLLGLAINVGGYLWSAALISEFLSLPAWAGAGVMVFISAYQGLVFALWAWGSRLAVRRTGVPWLLAVPAIMAIAENLIPMIFQHYIGFTVWRAWPLIQVAEVGGAPAVSALVVLVNALLVEALLVWRGQEGSRGALRWGAAVLAILLVTGTLRGFQVAAARRNTAQLQVGLVQSNFGVTSLDARERYGADYIRSLQEDTLALSERGADLIVWSESAWPYLFDRSLRQEFPPGHPWELRPGAEGRLLAGMLSHAFGTGSEVYDSVVLFTDSGEVAGIGDKSRMLFVLEKLPLAERFPGWAERMHARMPGWRPHLTPGESAAVLVDEELRIGALVCSEDLLMSYVHEAAREGANLLVTVGSDAWFPGAAAYQHAALATFRAVETRRDLARAMNNGISTLIDAVGRVQVESDYVPVPKDQPPGESELLMAQAALLDLPAAGPYTIRYFPYVCFLLLAAGMILAPKDRSS